jgi:hypothetical protein
MASVAWLRCVRLLRLFGLIIVMSLSGVGAWAADPVEIQSISAERADDGLFISSSLRFELSAAVEEALLKGIPITFVAEAQVYRDRWYWYDKKIAQTTRAARLAYQPLTRRWRVNILTNGAASGSGLSGSLSQNFDSLAEALGPIRRIARWKIAEAADIDADARYNVEFSFRLDTTQLPRPIQFGIATNPDWSLAITRNLRPETARSNAADKP